MARIFSLFILALALGGCVTYTGARSYVNDSRAELHRSAEGGRMPIAVIGNPFSGSTAKLEAMATAAFERHYRWLNAKFHAVPAKSSGHKIVIVFDPTATLHSSDICANPAGVTFDQSSAKMRVAAIYCTDSLVSVVWANLDRPGSLDDAVLAEVVDGLAWRVIPSSTKDERDFK